MERFGVERYDYNFDRHGCWVEFYYEGELYRFKHSVEKAREHGIELARGSGAISKVFRREGESMTDKARIEKGLYWDRAWSLVEGCTPVSAGCQNCWSARQTHMRAQQQNQKIQIRYTGLTEESGRFNGNIRLITENLDLPLITRKPTVWAIWNDLFHEDVPAVFIKKAWDIMAKCRQHTFLVLTKRPERMLAFTQWMAGVDDISIAEWPRNCWLGVTAENQQRADERIPVLLQIPAAVRFVSIEPMLGPIDLTKLIIPITGPGSSQPCAPETWRQINALTGDDYQYDWKCHGVGHQGPQLNWVICGGETGPGARPMHPDWVRSLVLQCKNAGVPIFVKQMGSVWAKAHSSDRASNRPEEWPEDLRIRELPPSRNCSLTP